MNAGAVELCNGMIVVEVEAMNAGAVELCNCAV
jgi:hypothetical protein